jgi:hypothetical protein
MYFVYEADMHEEYGYKFIVIQASKMKELPHKILISVSPAML